MSFISGTTGSDTAAQYGLTAAISGSGFGPFTGSSGGGVGSSENDSFRGRIFQVQWRSVDQPWVNYGGFLSNELIVDGGGGFNNRIQLPRGQIPSGQYDLIIELPITPSDTPQRPGLSRIPSIRYNVQGDVAVRNVTPSAPPATFQYQDYQLTPWQPIGGGTPEFGAGSGSIAG